MVCLPTMVKTEPRNTRLLCPTGRGLFKTRPNGTESTGMNFNGNFGRGDRYAQDKHPLLEYFCNTGKHRQVWNGPPLKKDSRNTTHVSPNAKRSTQR
ncbi:UNVERIFIED_CONTAM: hypothetical protein FKN15_028457 [Acipenser sinensis]